MKNLNKSQCSFGELRLAGFDLFEFFCNVAQLAIGSFFVQRKVIREQINVLFLHLNRSVLCLKLQGSLEPNRWKRFPSKSRWRI